MDFERLSDNIFSRLEPYQLARHTGYAELTYSDGKELPVIWKRGEPHPVVDEREWSEGIMYLRLNGQQTTREDENSAFVGCQSLLVGTIPLRLVLIAPRSTKYTPFDVSQTIASALTGVYSNLALQIGAQYVNAFSFSTESNTKTVLEDEFKDLEDVSFSSKLYAISVDFEVEVKGDAACLASESCDPIIPDPILEKVATPVFTPSGGTFGGFAQFELSCATPDAVIYYTLDGSPVTPQTGILYEGVVTLQASNVPKAKAFKTGFVDSDTSTGQYIVVPLSLSLDPEGGLFNLADSPLIVPITNNIDAEVFYTIDGTEPTELSIPFTSPYQPDQNRTVKAKAFLAPALPSATATEVYQLKLAAPTLDTASGVFISSKLVTATNNNPLGTNEYSIDGGAYVAGDSVLVEESASVAFRTVDAGYVTSDEVTISVEIQCAAPTISPPDARPPQGDPVSLATTTAGASIYYTTDGSEPTTSSTLYTVPIVFTENTTLKAIAAKSGTTNSNVATFNVVPIQEAWYAFVGSGPSARRTKNRGNTWLSGTVNNQESITLADATRIGFAVYQNELRRTLDYGDTFPNILTAPEPGAVFDGQQIMISKDGSTLICGGNISSQRKLYRSNDLGESFSVIRDIANINNYGVSRSATSSDGRYWYISQITSFGVRSVIRSDDFGTTFTAVSGITTAYFVGKIRCTDNGQRVFIVASATDGVTVMFRSDDFGETFELLPSIPQCIGVEISSDASIMYALCPIGSLLGSTIVPGAFYSTDYGDNWIALPALTFNRGVIACDPTGQFVFRSDGITTAATIHRSFDFGQTYELVTTGTTGLPRNFNLGQN